MSELPADFSFPKPSRTRARPSASASESGLESNKDSERAKTPLPFIRENPDAEADSDAHALARLIAECWGVDDPLDAVHNFGRYNVRKIHHRMKSMARKGRLADKKNLGGYFMRCLTNLRDGAPATVEDDRDAYIAEYLERQRKRGM